MGQRPWRSKSAAADRLLPTAGHRWTRCGVRGAVEAASSEHEFTRSGRTAAKRLPARRSLGRKPGRKARSLFCPATGGRQKETRDAIIPGRRRREVNRAGAFSPVLTSPPRASFRPSPADVRRRWRPELSAPVLREPRVRVSLAACCSTSSMVVRHRCFPALRLAMPGMVGGDAAAGDDAGFPGRGPCAAIVAMPMGCGNTTGSVEAASDFHAALEPNAHRRRFGVGDENSRNSP
jgi:hypothetical protein